MAQGRYISPLFLLIFFVGTPVFPEKGDYSRRIEYLNQRYKDFYIHENMRKRLDNERIKGAQAQKNYRKKLNAERNAARRSFIRSRKNRPALSLQLEFDKKYLKQKQKEEAQKNKARRRFAKQREMLKRIKEQAKKIPEAKEAGLE